MTSFSPKSIFNAGEKEPAKVYRAIEEIYESSASFSEKFPDKYPSVQSLANDIAKVSSEGMFIVYCEGKEILGFLRLEPQAASYLKHTAYFSMGVTTAAQGKGISRQLLQYMLANKGKETEIIYLMVRSDNQKAINLYEKFGFETRVVLAKDTKIEQKYFDGVLMSRCFL